MALEKYRKNALLLATILVFPISLYFWLIQPEIPFNEIQLTQISFTFELGLPLILVIVTIVSSAFRRYALVVLGALFPLLVMYVWLVAGYVLDPRENAWAFGAAWVMTFLPFSAMLWVGVIVSMLVPSRTKSFGAFCYGLAASISSALIFALFDQLIG